MAVDCAVELKKHNVTCVSLWPGAVQTESMLESANSGNITLPEVRFIKVFYENKKCLYNKVKFYTNFRPNIGLNYHIHV